MQFNLHLLSELSLMNEGFCGFSFFENVEVSPGVTSLSRQSIHLILCCLS